MLFSISEDVNSNSCQRIFGRLHFPGVHPNPDLHPQGPYGIAHGSGTVNGAGWAGEWGMVLHSNCNYRSPALTGE